MLTVINGDVALAGLEAEVLSGAIARELKVIMEEGFQIDHRGIDPSEGLADLLGVH